MKTSAAWLVERAGFGRGYGAPGPIMVSTKHSLALTNRGGGTTAQLLALAHEIQQGVRRRFGVELTPEPTFVGDGWRAPREPLLFGVLALSLVDGAHDLLRLRNAAEREVRVGRPGRVEVHGPDLEDPVEHALLGVHVLHALEPGLLRLARDDARA